MAHRSAGPYRTNRTLNPRMFSDQLLLFDLFNDGIILLLALDLWVPDRTLWIEDTATGEVVGGVKW